MRWLIVLLAIGAGVLFFGQNPQPIVLKFFGSQESTALLALKLPLAAWVLAFTLAGMATSLLLQLLYSRPRTSRSWESYARETPPYSPPPSGSPPRQEATSPFSSLSSPGEESGWEVREAASDEDWDIEKLPPKPIATPEESQPERSQSFEAEQQPQSSSRQGSLYSYTYRPSGDRPRSPQPPTPPVRDGVYEANYRVILPPHRNRPESRDEGREEEEED